MSSGRPTKRRRTTAGGIGAPSEADTPSAQANAPSSAAYSTRRVVTNVHTLSSLCIDVFAASFHMFSSDTNIWQPNSRWEKTRELLKLVPDSTIPRLLAALMASHPNLLSSDLLRDNFLRGSALLLSSDLGGGMNKNVIAAVPLMGSSLISLSLYNFDKIEDVGFEKVVSKLPHLQSLNLRGCSRVGPRTLSSAAKHCGALDSLNLNYTSVTPVQLAPFLNARKDALRVLKVAIPTWTDALFAKLQSELHMDTFKMTALQTLKLRQTSLSDVSLNAILACCPHIRRLDLSFTRVKTLSPVSLESMTGLEKSSLTSTDVPKNHLIKILQHAQGLRTLNIGAMGGGRGQSVGLGNASALTMTDDVLVAVTKAIGSCVTALNLVGNAKIGQRRQPILDLLESMRERVKVLNLTGLTALRSSDLAALEEEGGAPALEVLSLSRTNIDDIAAPYIAACPSLRVLDVAATRMTSDGLYTIISACPSLAQLDLTKCRSVPLGARRSIFEEWEKARDADDGSEHE
ncbi:RNI-like protein [Peniophora sp. CONT]|nr:RNI-like protein [Peniophora sp. CONT]